MRFAGLFDCKKYKAHGEALLVYNQNGTLTEEEKMKISSASINASWEDAAKERLPVLAPLNYAPYDKNANEYKSDYIPITNLKHIQDKKSKKGKSHCCREITFAS